MEKNLGKYIPHFKTYNSMMPLWGNTDFGNDQLYPVYSAINKAREISPALRSSNRYFINQTSGSPQESIYSVAKYESAGISPNLSDVVFAFMNLDRNNNQSGTFNVNLNGGSSNLFGIKAGRTYNVKNLAAYTGVDATRRNVWLWGSGLTGANILANGIFVGLNKVPASAAAWTNAPFEAQYLKLYDVTPPAAPGSPVAPAGYAVGTNAMFSWLAASEPEGGVSGYRLIVGTTPGASNVFAGLVTGTNRTVSGSLGQTLYARISVMNNAGIEGSPGPVSAGVLLLDPAADQDNDGMNNAAEAQAGTDPLNGSSLLRIISQANANQLTWSSVPGKTYRVQMTTNLLAPFADLSSPTNATSATVSYTDVAATNGQRFYRVMLMP
jgi:hypothetical protein